MTRARDLANAGPAFANVDATELGYLDGVSSNVQTQINAKATYPTQTGNSGKYLTTDGSAASWGTISAGGMTLLASGSLGGTQIDITGISQSYQDLKLYIRNWSLTANSFRCAIRINGITTGYYSVQQNYSTAATVDTNSNAWFFSGGNSSAAFTNNSCVATFPDYTASSLKMFSGNCAWDGVNGSYSGGMNSSATAAISTISIWAQGQTFDSGTYYLYGVK